jgi:hypothetical protein
MGAEELGQNGHVPASYLKMKLVSAPDVEVHYPALEFFLQRRS